MVSIFAISWSLAAYTVRSCVNKKDFRGTDGFSSVLSKRRLQKSSCCRTGSTESQNREKERKRKIEK
jgi:hypothetical protein